MLPGILISCTSHASLRRVLAYTGPCKEHILYHLFNMNKILHYLASVARPDTALVGMLRKSSYHASTGRHRCHHVGQRRSQQRHNALADAA
jgi:hypothetical protein